MKNIKVISIIIGLLLAIVIFEKLGIKYSNKELFKSCQPSNIDYQSYGPYCLYIVKENQVLSSNLVLKIAKQDDPKGVYHSMNFPYSVTEVNSTNLSVNWSESGVSIQDQSGFKMDVPKAKFIGGR